MYDHVGLKVKNVGTSVRFYRAALAPLGHEVASQDEASAGLGPKGAPALWLSASPAAAASAQSSAQSSAHVAFAAASQEAVDRFHAAGLAAGGRDNGAPGLRKDDAPNYYAAFLIDPDGNNVEAVRLR